MPSPEENGQSAYTAAVTGAEDKLAGTLAQYSQLLPGFYPEVNMPAVANENAYRHMARELIDTRKFTAPTVSGGTMEISLDDLEAKDAANGGKMQAALGGPLSNAVPTREQVNTIASTIGNSVAEETGSIGFLDGATIMGAIMGFIQWLINGFTHGFDKSPGLKETIVGVTAKNMGNAVGNDLTKLRSERPDMAGMLTDDNILETVQTTYYTVMEKGEFPSPNAPVATSIKDIKPMTIDETEIAKLQAQIKEGVMYPENDKPLADKISDQIIANRKEAGLLGWAFGPGDDEAKQTGQKMAPIIADTIAEKSTDPEFARTLSGKSPEQHAAMLANEVGKALVANEATLGFPKKFSDKNDQGVTYLDVIKAQVAEGIESNYEGLSGASRLAALSDNKAKDQALAAVDPKARDIVTGDGRNHDEIIVQAGGKNGTERTL